MSKFFAEVIGDPIAHSKSPLIHGFWLEKLGLAERFDYRRCHVRSEELDAYFSERRADPRWVGCNITIPHKQAVLPLVDRIDQECGKIGAVNTVVREPENCLAAYNTDLAGFLEPLKPILSDRHLLRMARVIGTGGAARAIVHALASKGFLIAMIARDPAKARALLDEVEPDAPDSMIATLESWREPSDFAWDDRSGVLDLVVNATSLGMTGSPPLDIDFSHIPPGAVIYDAVYAPLETALLAGARRQGLRVIDGLEMLVGQAAIAFEKFFGSPAPRQYDAELRARLTA